MISFFFFGDSELESRNRGGEGKTDSLLSREPDVGLDPRTTGL